jgi:hypothetical protein
MKQPFPYKLVLVLALLSAALSVLGIVGLALALKELESVPAGVSVDWSGFLIPLAHLLVLLAVSLAAIFGVSRGRPAVARIAAMAFCVGVALLVCARWLLLLVIASPFPGMGPALFSATVVAGLLFLAASLRPNYALKPTAGDVRSSSEPPGPAAA